MIPSPSGPGRIRAVRRRDPLEIALFALSALIAVPVLAGYLLDLGGLPLRPAYVGLACAAIAAVLLVLGTRLPRSGTGCERSRIVGAAWTFVAVVAVGLAFSGPSLLPASTSVDAVNHYVLAEFILRHQSLVHGWPEAGYLGEMAAYPFAAALDTALLSRFSGVPLLRLMHLVPSLLAGLCALFVYAIVADLAQSGRDRAMAAVVIAPVFLAVPFYTVAIFAREYFEGQLFAIVCLVGAWYWLLRYSRQPSTVPVAAAILLGWGIVFSHPIYAVLFGLMVLLVPRVGAERVPLRRHARDAGLLGVGLVLVPLPFLVDPLRRQLGASWLGVNGGVQPPGFVSMPMPWLALALAGVAVMTVVPRLRAASAGIWVVAAGCAAMGLLSYRALVAPYHFYKLFYTLAPPLVVAIAVATILVARRLPAIAVVLVVALPLAGWYGKLDGIIPARGDRATLRPEHLALAEAVRTSGGLAEPPAYVTLNRRSLVAPLWVQVGLVGGDRAFQWSDDPLDYARWYLGDLGQSRMAITDGADALLGPEAKVLYRSGGAALVERLPRPTAATRDLAVIAAELHGSRAAPGDSVDATAELLVGQLRSRYQAVLRFRGVRGDPAGEAGVPVPWELAGDRRARLAWSVPVARDAASGVYDAELLLFTVDWRAVAVSEPVRVGRVLVADAADVGPGVAPPGTQLGARFAEPVELVGSDEPAVAEMAIDVRLVWRPTGQISRDYSVFLQLLDPSGRVVSQADGYPWEGRYPTSAWVAGQTVQDRRRLKLPADLAPGRYSVIAGLYRLDTLARVALLAPGGDFVRVATVEITGGRKA